MHLDGMALVGPDTRAIVIERVTLLFARGDDVLQWCTASN